MIKKLSIVDRNLHELKLQYDNKCLFSDKMAYKASEIWTNSNYAESDKPIEIVAIGIKNAIEAVKFFTYGMAGLIADEFETKKRKKQLIETIDCNEGELAIDINELLELKEKTLYYGDNFTYNVVTSKPSLKNIQMIFGDAHLEALDEMTCLANLRSVWGNVHFSRCTDLTGLRLQAVGGDIHGEKLSTPNGLEELIYVGGTIFYQEKEYSFEKFQSEVLSLLDVKNNVK